MNKPYFAKYLPVEGEIKEGDKFLINNPHPQGQLRTAYRVTNDNKLWNGKDWDTLTGKHYFIDPTPEQGSGFVTELECKKAKLFLCSRDTKSGDVVYTICEFKNPTEKYDFSELDQEAIEKSFKVIGEISLGAKWVKEGDEFTKEEIMPSLIENWKYQVYIKGPRGYFH